jgi:hypothetical protein
MITLYDRDTAVFEYQSHNEHASTDAMKNLLQLRPATEMRLLLKTDQWLPLADDIR